MAKIYTKTGDLGETGLFGGPRVPKDHIRIEAYGTVDELNAQIALADSAEMPGELHEVLVRVESELFAVGAELATPDPAAFKMQLIQDPHIQQLESEIDRFETQLPKLEQFILPGGTAASASLHAARAVCRRAERRVVTLSRDAGDDRFARLIIYLNRLSDLLFVMARVANHAQGVADVPWRKP